MGLESGSNVFKKNVWMENIELLSTDLKGSNEETALNDNTDELDNMIDCNTNRCIYVLATHSNRVFGLEPNMA